MDKQNMHEAVAELVPTGEGELLTGWVIIYEYIDERGRAGSGHAYGPEGMTTWKILGLIEWVRRFTLRPGEDEQG